MYIVIPITIRNFLAPSNERTSQLGFRQMQVKIKWNKLAIKINAFSLQDSFVTNQEIKKFTNEILVISKPYLLGWWGTHYKKLTLPNIFSEGEQISTITSGTNDYLTNEKDSFFLLYNRNSTKTFRVQVMLWLLKTGLINDTKFSFLIKGNDIDLNLLILQV